MTATEALAHPWIDTKLSSPTVVNLLPNVRMGFNARKTFQKAIGVVKAVNNFSRPSSSINLNISAPNLLEDAGTVVLSHDSSSSIQFPAVGECL